MGLGNTLATLTSLGSISNISLEEFVKAPRKYNFSFVFKITMIAQGFIQTCSSLQKDITEQMLKVEIKEVGRSGLKDKWCMSQGRINITSGWNKRN